MANKKSNKQKFIVLVAASVVLALASYFLSISKTLEARSEHVSLTQKMAGADRIAPEIAKWMALNEQLDDRLGGQQVLSGFHEILLGSVGKYCNQKDLTLTDFSEPFEGEDGGYLVETIVLTIEGGFKPLLGLVHHLETQFRGGKVASVSFIKKKNYRKNREELFLEVYVQKIKMKKNEDL